MPEKFQGRYRIPSARASWWDYSQCAAYFVTACTKNRRHYFGKVCDGVMHLSAIGEIVVAEWLNTPALRPDMNLYLGAFTVMPNHMHGIIEIGRDAMHCVSDSNGMNVRGQDAMHCVSTGGGFGPQSKNLGSIMRGFKSAVTVKSRLFDTGFNWQPRFHDHIIRDERSYQLITDYILHNPANWNKDKFYL